jgi:hypothetical protein
MKDRSEWVSEWLIVVLTPNDQFFSYIMARTSSVQLDNNDVCFVLDQQKGIIGHGLLWLYHFGKDYGSLCPFFLCFLPAMANKGIRNHSVISCS